MACAKTNHQTKRSAGLPNTWTEMMSCWGSSLGASRSLNLGEQKFSNDDNQESKLLKVLMGSKRVCVSLSVCVCLVELITRSYIIFSLIANIWAAPRELWIRVIPRCSAVFRKRRAVTSSFLFSDFRLRFVTWHFIYHLTNEFPLFIKRQNFSLLFTFFSTSSETGTLDAHSDTRVG